MKSCLKLPSTAMGLWSHCITFLKLIPVKGMRVKSYGTRFLKHKAECISYELPLRMGFHVPVPLLKCAYAVVKRALFRSDSSSLSPQFRVSKVSCSPDWESFRTDGSLRNFPFLGCTLQRQEVIDGLFVCLSWRPNRQAQCRSTLSWAGVFREKAFAKSIFDKTRLAGLMYYSPALSYAGKPVLELMADIMSGSENKCEC
jgi:hypothetical protein